MLPHLPFCICCFYQHCLRLAARWRCGDLDNTERGSRSVPSIRFLNTKLIPIQMQSTHQYELVKGVRYVLSLNHIIIFTNAFHWPKANSPNQNQYLVLSPDLSVIQPTSSKDVSMQNHKGGSGWDWPQLENLAPHPSKETFKSHIYSSG